MTNITPLPPHTVAFIESATPRTLLEILCGFFVEIDKRIFSTNTPANRAELERRVKLLLADTQRLSIVLPKTTTTYASLPPWTARNISRRGFQEEGGPMTEVFAKCFNYGQAEKMEGRITEITEFEFYKDTCQILVSMASSFEKGHPKFTIQDSGQNSGVLINVVEVRRSLVDPNLPILFVLFLHETTPHARPGCASLNWIQNVFQTGNGIPQVNEGSEANSHLLLRQLVYNSHRLPPGCEPMFERARNRVYEKDFIPSFILPMDTLSRMAIERLGRSEKCGRTSCTKPALSVCAGCGTIHYCSQTCQKAHREAHRELCSRISTTSPPLRSASFIVFPRIDTKDEDYDVFDREYLSQRDMDREAKRVAAGVSIISNPFVDRGFLTSFARRGSKERFVVRMQESMSGAVLLVYDASKTFSVHVRVVPELCELVAANRKWKGQRCYLYARHLDGDKGRNQLEILLDVMPDQGLFW